MKVLVKVLNRKGEVFKKAVMDLDTAAERFVSLTLSADKAILMRHTLLAGGMYEYNHRYTRLEITPVQENGDEK